MCRSGRRWAEGRYLVAGVGWGVFLGWRSGGGKGGSRQRTTSNTVPLSRRRPEAPVERGVLMRAGSGISPDGLLTQY